MARPLRIEFANAIYHVLSRGVGRREIYHCDRDYEIFLDKLESQADRYQVEVRAYCLMKNHFHLYLRTPEANLSKFMQSLLTAYAVSKNRRDRRSGHLFQGRFKGHLIEDDVYGDAVSRYIHLNPVRVKRIAALPVEERQTILRTFTWSSYAATVGLRKCPTWLARSAVLARWGDSVREQQKSYCEFVERGLIRRIDNPLDSAAAQLVVGSDAFVDRIRRLYVDVSANINVRREQGQAWALKSWVSFEQLQELVAEAYGCDPATLLAPHQRGNEGRLVLQYLSMQYCRGRYTLVELSERFEIGIGGLTSAHTRCQGKLKASRVCRRRVTEIESRLQARDQEIKK